MFKRTIAMAMGVAVLAALASAPAMAQTIPPSNVGGGALTGRVDFAAGMGVPPVNAPCEPTSWTFTGGSPSGVTTAAALNTVLTGYAGPITINASGGSPCENAEGGTGTLTLTATGRGPTGSEIDCPAPGGTPLSGTFDRTGTHTTVDVRGQCVVNRYGISNVRFLAVGEFLPSDSSGGPTVGPGLLGPVNDATFTGVFGVLPL